MKEMFSDFKILTFKACMNTLTSPLAAVFFRKSSMDRFNEQVQEEHCIEGIRPHFSTVSNLKLLNDSIHLCFQ